ncbi:hypothetical protein [Paenibacillus cymbidii]|uniref:hypothetical protein n=1 Tax=Paenibacillus cymbidii TaxID=1639034 RepID=UPI00107FF0E6|nr:hypothetical protein [Paenibacillus cymbidii]
MFIFGAIVAVGLVIALLYWAGTFGGIMLTAIVVGVIFATYWRVREIQLDIRQIKEKLGIGAAFDRPPTNEEIEQELEADPEWNGESWDGPVEADDPNDPKVRDDPDNETNGKPSHRRK